MIWGGSSKRDITELSVVTNSRRMLIYMCPAFKLKDLKNSPTLEGTRVLLVLVLERDPQQHNGSIVDQQFVCCKCKQLSYSLGAGLWFIKSFYNETIVAQWYSNSLGSIKFKLFCTVYIYLFVYHRGLSQYKFFFLQTDTSTSILFCVLVDTKYHRRYLGWLSISMQKSGRQFYIVDVSLWGNTAMCSWAPPNPQWGHKPQIHFLLIKWQF